MDRFDFASKRILIVEDDFVLGEYLSLLLHAAGARPVGPASSELAALDLLHDQPVDAALLEGFLSGKQTCEHVAAALKQRAVPFIVMTGYERGSLPVSVRQELYMAKPLMAEEVLQGLSLLLAAPAGLPQHARHMDDARDAVRPQGARGGVR